MNSIRNLSTYTWRKVASSGARISFGLTDNRRRLKRLRDKFKGRRGFVLGNGPSLVDTDPGRLVDEVTIASNGIFLLFDKTPYRPLIYTVEDRLVAEDRAEQINQLDGMTKIIPWDLKKFIKPAENTIYVNFIRGAYRGFPAMSPDLSSCGYWGGTVSFFNLQVAYHLGLNPIYLIGFDHNYAPPKPEDAQEGVVITSRTDDVNHFDPNYFGPGYRWHDPRVDRMEAAYRVAREFLTERGTQVFNATAGGKLEVFERVDYNDLF